jgi:hypothetical protein
LHASTVAALRDEARRAGLPIREELG